MKSAGKIDKDDEPELDSNDPAFDGQLNARPEDFELDPDEVF